MARTHDVAGGARLAHLGLVVGDLARMRHFYAEVLDLAVTDSGISARRGREMVFLSGEAGVHHALMLVEGERGASGGLDHIAFTVPSLAALRGVRDRAAACGAAGLRAADHGNAWSIYFVDPEGNAVEVFVPAPFAMTQPSSRALDLDRSDDDIIAETKRACAG
ncbi:VOC family protein [Elioraea rosea]|uniref:VOC family protein n=1 Tax=Elioraea rosea TaxID=2492390 RepID=UPI001184340E|nr:VOC family protein [Elioraea rosea]